MNSRFQQAKAALRAKGGAPSLILSFVILHEITAIVPFGLTFCVSRTLGVGNSIVQSLVSEEYCPRFPWIQQSIRSVISEGESRVAAKYSSGDIANAIVAYAAVKALLPVRIGVSVYLSPAFSRRIIHPVYHILGKTKK